MKAERRHELQHNDLAAWLAKKFIAVRPYVITVVAAIVAVVVVWMGYSWYAQGSAAAKAETWNQYYASLNEAAAGDDAKLRDFIRVHAEEPAGLVARQRFAMMKMSIAAARQLSSRDASREAYQEAIDEFAQVRQATNDDTLKRFVSYQIALARESRYDLDEATTEYKSIVEKWPGSMEAERAEFRLADLKNPETKDLYEWHRTVNPSATPPVAPQAPVEPDTNLDALPDAPPAETDAPPAETDAPKATVPDENASKSDDAAPSDSDADAPSDPPATDEKPGDEPATDPVPPENAPSDDAPTDTTPTDGETTDGETADEGTADDNPTSDEPTPDDAGLNPPNSSS